MLPVVWVVSLGLDGEWVETSHMELAHSPIWFRTTATATAKYRQFRRKTRFLFMQRLLLLFMSQALWRTTSMRVPFGFSVSTFESRCYNEPSQSRYNYSTRLIRSRRFCRCPQPFQEDWRRIKRLWRGIGGLPKDLATPNRRPRRALAARIFQFLHRDSAQTNAI